VNKEAAEHPADIFRCSGCKLPECQGPTGCARTSWRFEPGGYLKQILIAKHRVYDLAHESPLEEAHGLSEQLGNRILLKREDQQPVFSFKVRGAFNRMSQLTPEQLAKGVICASAGNHAQGVALAAKKLGYPATIVMPTTAQEIKLKAVQRLGAEIEQVGETLAESTVYAQAKAEREGRVFVPPFDDADIIAGQGTVGDELLSQCQEDWKNLYAIFVPIGGGGLIAGITAYIKAIKPDVKIIGVEPYGANSMAASLALGRRVTLTKVDTFADGVALKRVGAEPFRICKAGLDGCVLVSNASIAAAIGDLCNEKRSILEPAGALALAGAKAYLQRYNIRNKTVVCVLTGANMSIQRLAMVSEMADLGARREAMLISGMPETPGSIRRWVEVVQSAPGPDLLFTELKYRCSSGDDNKMLWSVAIDPEVNVGTIVELLNHNGFNTMDISEVEVAQAHLRSFVGGRARAVVGDIADEVVYQVEIPERLHNIRDLLEAQGALNITLFHYRRSGGSSSQLLFGLQLPEKHQAAFDASVAKLGKGFSFSKLKGKELDAFRMLSV